MNNGPNQENLFLLYKGMQDKSSNLNVLNKDIVSVIFDKYYGDINLLTKYIEPLDQLDKIIESSCSHLLRCDHQMAPNIIDAIEAIKTNTDFIPTVASSGMSAIKELSSSPVNALKELLLDDYLSNHFQEMISHYCKDQPELQKTLRGLRHDVKKFVSRQQQYLQTEVIIYKSKSGQLAIKFNTADERQHFINALGGQQQFSMRAKFNAGKKCPEIFAGNKTTLYIPGYTARNGELATCFPNINMREKFISLLNLKENQLISTYPGQAPLYVNDKSIHTPFNNIKLNVKFAIASDLPEQSQNKKLTA